MDGLEGKRVTNAPLLTEQMSLDAVLFSNRDERDFRRHLFVALRVGAPALDKGGFIRRKEKMRKGEKGGKTSPHDTT